MPRPHKKIPVYVIGLVGSDGVGKTSFERALQPQSFYTSCFGEHPEVTYIMAKESNDEIGGPVKFVLVNAELTKKLGCGRGIPCVDFLYCLNGLIVMSAADDRISHEEAIFWQNKSKSYLGESFPVVYVANKCDLQSPHLPLRPQNFCGVVKMSIMNQTDLHLPLLMLARILTKMPDLQYYEQPPVPPPLLAPPDEAVEIQNDNALPFSDSDEGSAASVDRDTSQVEMPGGLTLANAPAPTSLESAGDKHEHGYEKDETVESTEENEASSDTERIEENGALSAASSPAQMEDSSTCPLQTPLQLMGQPSPLKATRELRVLFAGECGGDLCESLKAFIKGPVRYVRTSQEHGCKVHELIVTASTIVTIKVRQGPTLLKGIHQDILRNEDGLFVALGATNEKAFEEFERWYRIMSHHELPPTFLFGYKRSEDRQEEIQAPNNLKFTDFESSYLEMGALADALCNLTIKSDPSQSTTESADPPSDEALSANESPARIPVPEPASQAGAEMVFPSLLVDSMMDVCSRAKNYFGLNENQNAQPDRKQDSIHGWLSQMP